MKLGVRVQATVVRAARPYWAHQPTSGEGAASFGGRFNAIGTPALYCSFSFNTCAREVRFSLNADPYTFYFLNVDCTDVADLTDASVMQSVGLHAEQLSCPNWESQMHAGNEPDSHQLARRLIDERYAGIIVPSFAAGATPEDRNLVLWHWDDTTDSNVSSTHSVKVLVRDQLPRDGRSWS